MICGAIGGGFVGLRARVFDRFEKSRSSAIGQKTGRLWPQESTLSCR